MKADISAPITPINTMCMGSDRDASIKVFVIRYTAPDLTNPAETTSTSATMIVAGCPNPEKASELGTTPVRTPISSAENATRSYRMRPHNSSQRRRQKVKIKSAGGQSLFKNFNFTCSFIGNLALMRKAQLCHCGAPRQTKHLEQSPLKCKILGKEVQIFFKKLKFYYLLEQIYGASALFEMFLGAA